MNNSLPLSRCTSLNQSLAKDELFFYAYVYCGKTGVAPLEVSALQSPTSRQDERQCMETEGL